MTFRGKTGDICLHIEFLYVSVLTRVNTVILNNV